MGQKRTKVIDSAIDTEKAAKVEKETEKVAAEKSGKAPKEKPPKVRSNRYKSLLKEMDKAKEYTINEAIEIIKRGAKTKFDESIEVHININFQKDKTDHQIRTAITLPHQSTSKGGSGKKVKILVFTSKKTDEIKKLGADIGTEATLKSIGSGKIEHNKIVADSEWMPKIAKLAKVLGPKGLMPNPKSGTVTDDPLTLLKEFSKGKTEIRTEKLPIVHAQIGRLSLDDKKLAENFGALIEAVKSAKPESLKKTLFKSIYISSTMGPSVKISLGSL